MKRSPAVVHCLLLAILVWINLYIAREFFLVEYTGYMNSMHGFWIAIARLAGDSWWRPTWWPFWDGGMPFEYTYAPLVPGLSALWSSLGRISEAAAFQRISGVVYCTGPVVVYAFGFTLLRSAGYAFAAGAAYSLLAPTQLIVPDDPFQWAHFWDARRLYLTAVWDDVPHLAGLSLTILSVVLLQRSLHPGRWLSWIAATLCIAAAWLASLFSATVLVIAGACFLAAWGPGQGKRCFLLLTAANLTGWIIASPFASPSFLLHLREVSQTYPEGRIGWQSPAGLLLVALAGWLVCRWCKPAPRRFLALFTIAVSAPPLVQHYLGWNLLPQPARYKFEMELALVVLATVLAAHLLAPVRRIGIAGLSFLLVFLLSTQIIGHRRFAKNLFQQPNITKTIEFRAADWVNQNLPGRRIMFPGSMAQWANAFAPVTQFTGSSFSVAPNLAQQKAVEAIYRESIDVALRWLTAFGVDAIWVSGRQSAEFWKPFPHPELYAHRLRPLVEQQGTILYDVGRKRPGLTHAISEDSLVVKEEPAQLEKFIAAMDRSPHHVSMKWISRNRLLIHRPAGHAGVLTVQINHHRGWRASVDGKSLDVHRDALGLIWLKPQCAGPCSVELTYDGGRELRLLRWLSFTALALLAGVAIFSLFRGSSSSASPPSEAHGPRHSRGLDSVSRNPGDSPRPGKTSPAH